MAIKLSPVLEAQAWVEVLQRESKGHAYHAARFLPVLDDDRSLSTPLSTTKCSFQLADMHIGRSMRMPAAGLPQSLITYRAFSASRTDGLQSMVTQAVPTIVAPRPSEQPADPFTSVSAGYVPEKLSFVPDVQRDAFGKSIQTRSPQTPRRLPPVRVPAAVPADLAHGYWQQLQASKDPVSVNTWSFMDMSLGSRQATPRRQIHGANLLPSSWQPQSSSEFARVATAAFASPDSRQGTPRNLQRVVTTPNAGARWATALGPL